MRGKAPISADAPPRQHQESIGALLTALGVLSYLTRDHRATVVIFVMVILGVVLRFFQEMRADHAAEKPQAMVSNTATLVRGGKEEDCITGMWALPATESGLLIGVILTRDQMYIRKCVCSGRALLDPRKNGENLE